MSGVVLQIALGTSLGSVLGSVLGPALGTRLEVFLGDAAGLAASAPRLIRDLLPFAGLEIDDAGIARIAPALARGVRQRGSGPSPQRRDEQRGAQDIRYKTRKYQ